MKHVTKSDKVCDASGVTRVCPIYSWRVCDRGRYGQILTKVVEACRGRGGCIPSFGT